MNAPRNPPIARCVVPSAVPSDHSPARIAREFRGLLESGCVLRPAGTARRRPRLLLERGYTPRYRVELFGTTFYVSNVRQNEDLRFFVGYVRQGGREIYPRLLYKDVSLIWRSASHVIRSDEENWIGKGAVEHSERDGDEFVESVESTTDLPLELQNALEGFSRKPRRILRDEVAVGLVLRAGPDDRIEPYRDFSEPRRRAAADPRNLVNKGRPIARFRRRLDPTSLEFVKGFEPDFGRRGVLEVSHSSSRLYGGALQRFRIVSRNRLVQYLFFAGPKHTWIGYPQATTTELSTYGVRTIDVHAPEDAFIPAFEYHFLDTGADPPEWVSQIPEGFAGPNSEVDPSRADASPWLDQLPVIREFRRRVLGRR